MEPSFVEISVVTPAYNAQRFIKKTIESVCAQTFANWELIIVVDGNSTDNTEVIAHRQAAQDSRIKVLSKQTKGVAANRNLGIADAKANLVCLLDSDDWWHPEKLEKQYRFMKDSGVTFSYTAYDCMSEDGTSYNYTVVAAPCVTYAKLLRSNLIGCLSIMIDKRFHPNFFFQQENHEDYTLWLRLLRGGAIARGLNERLAYYRLVKGSRSNNKLNAARWRWRIYRRQERLPVFTAMRYFVLYMTESLFRRYLKNNNSVHRV
jgi:teichuronic acid biosynthesis glycosyltransferase TuaG